MNPVDVVGLLLASAIFVFAVGAARWKLAYEGSDALSLIHVDRRRRTWIHIWMIPGVLLSSTGLFGFALLAADAVMFVAASLFAIGAVLMLVHLLFRLTVVPWAAQQRVETGSVPHWFEPIEKWVGSMYVLHMAISYATFAVIGAGLLISDLLPNWVGWTGVVIGLVCLLGFTLTRFAGPFNPPILAHTYPTLLGLVIIWS